MIQRMCFRLVAALLLLSLWVTTTQTVHASGQKAKRPNILFIMSDDHAQAACSCYGSWLTKVFKTPNIDRLAKEGTRFVNALVTNSICTPSRGAILTGQYSHKNGIYTLGDRLDPNMRHVVHLLRDAGYQTAIFGKWHLKIDPTGFDSWTVLPGQGIYIDPFMKTPKGKKRFKGYSTDVITDLSLDWLKNRDKNKPFVLMCQYKAPHRPWDPNPKYKGMFDDVKFPEPPTLYDDYKNRSHAAANTSMVIGEHFNKRDIGGIPVPKGLKGNALRKWAYQIYMKRYLSCIRAVDDNIGRILDYLDKSGLAENTIVIYFSDQGFFLGEHGYYDKRFMYEPCLTTPCVVRYPGHVLRGSVREEMALNIDLAPTFLDYANVEIPKKMQGVSLRPLLEQKETPKDWRKSMYYRYYMHLAHHDVPAHYGVRTDRYTLIRFYGLPLGTAGSKKTPRPMEWELFDRQKDPLQIRNVYDEPEYANVVRELKTELRRLKKHYGDTKPIPGDNW